MKHEQSQIKYPFLPAGLVTLALLSALPQAATSQNFASSVFQSENLNGNPPYGDPKAALGQPTTLIDGALDVPPAIFHASVVYPAYNTDPDGHNLLVSLGAKVVNNLPSALTVAFDAPIVHDARHWYGQDFIVFGVSSFSGSGFVASDTDMSRFTIATGNVNQNGTPTAAVSADGVSFTTLAPSSIFFPTNSYHWTGITADSPSGWGPLNDFTKPVDPTLTASAFAGQTVAYAANTLYNGSSGGASFSLAGTPFATTGVRYVRFTGTGSIDAVSRVSFNPAAVPETGTLAASLFGLAFGAMFLRRQKRLKRKTFCA